MRTNIVIDQELMREAMEASGAKTRREAVDRALHALVLRERRLAVLDLAGNGWSGDLDEMRRDRDFG